MAVSKKGLVAVAVIEPPAELSEMSDSEFSEWVAESYAYLKEKLDDE